MKQDTGIILKGTGERWSEKRDGPNDLPGFQNFEDAVSYKDKLLRKYPFGEVSIISDENVKVYRDEKKLEVYLKERAALYRWQSLPFFVRWFIRKPECFVYTE